MNRRKMLRGTVTVPLLGVVPMALETGIPGFVETVEDPLSLREFRESCIVSFNGETYILCGESDELFRLIDGENVPALNPQIRRGISP